MATRPTFQPQNPAKSGCRLGWLSCTCFAGAMAASFDQQSLKIVTGCAVRTATHDTSGGTTLPQVDTAINALTRADLSLHFGLPWADFARMINSGMAGVLQGWYAPIADSRFDAGNGFRGNHAVLVLPGWVVMDPLADGRYAGVYKYHGEVYPQALLRDFAGKLNLSTTGYRALGAGKVYAGMTRDRVHDYKLMFDGGKFWVYALGPDGKIAGRRTHSFSGPTSVSCTPPRWVTGNSASRPPAGYSDVDGGRTLALVTSGTALRGQWVAVPQWNVHVKVIA